MAALSELPAAPHCRAMRSCPVWGLGNGVAGGGAGTPARLAWPGCRMNRLFQASPSISFSHRLAQLPTQTRGLFSSGLWLLKLGSGHSTQGSLYLACVELTLYTLAGLGPGMPLKVVEAGDSVSPRAPQSIWVPGEVAVQRLGFVLLRAFLVLPSHLMDGETETPKREGGLLWDSVNPSFYPLSDLCFECGSRNLGHTEY